MKTILISGNPQQQIQFKQNDNSLEITIAIVDRMRSGIAHFFFKKADGTMREAYGTLAPECMPPVNYEGTEGKAAQAGNPGVQRYYDLGANAWRAFTIANAVALI